MTTWPHDDTESLIDFYGDPDDSDFSQKNIVGVYAPFKLFYDGRAWPHPIQIHKKCASALKIALDDIWAKAKNSQDQIDSWGISNFSGSYVPRNVRGGSRKSCHAFGAAIDWDAENLPLGSTKHLPDPVENSFEDTGAFVGDNFQHRKDPMHVQYANEDVQRADMENPQDPNQVVAYNEDHVAVPHSHTDQIQTASYTRPAYQEPQYYDDTNVAKPMVQSKIAQIGTGVGTAGGGVAYQGYMDAATEAARHATRHHPATIMTTFQHLIHQPLFWVGLAIVIGAGLVIYYRWRDHGKGPIF